MLFSPIKPVGGISTWTLNILDYVKVNGESLAFSDASLFFKKGINSTSFFKRYFLSGLFDTIILFFSFIYSIVKYRPSVIHINTSASLALFKDYFYVCIASLFHAKVVFHYHFGRIPEIAKKCNWEWKLLQSCIRKSKQVIVIDPMSFDTLIRYGFAEKIVYVPNPCSSLVQSIAKRAVSDKQKGHFIFVGHVIPFKGVIELVEAFVSIDIPLRLTIIGLCSKEMEKILRNIATRKPGNWLSIVGNKSQDFVLEEMQIAEALILPSYTEGFPNVILEAMACGCPVLATSVGAIPEMLSVDSRNDACGLCFSPCSVDALRDAVIEFIDSPVDKIKFAVNGKKNVLNSYTMDIVYPQYKKVWYTK
nr:glycosyltransferase family 4 protein [Bacteroides intestinalis]